jgi:hypothetical protein
MASYTTDDSASAANSPRQQLSGKLNSESNIVTGYISE